MLADATPVVRDHLRPLLRRAIPLVRDLRPAVMRIDASTPPLIGVAQDANYIANELLYNPPGPEEGYLFWTTWFLHNADSILSIEDAHGAAWRGLVVVGCSTLGQVTDASPALAPLKDVPICPKAAAKAASK